MAFIDSITVQADDPTAAEHFYSAAFDLGSTARVSSSSEPTTGFRGFTMSLIVAQPTTATNLVDSALAAGATALKPATKSFWGFGGVVQAPDGTIWKIASSNKKDKGPDTGAIDQVVLLLGVADMKASKNFYLDKGFEVAKSYGRKYVEFESGSGAVTLALYPHRGLAKDAGVDADGSGSHRLVVGSAAGPFTDPDGFVFES